MSKISVDREGRVRVDLIPIHQISDFISYIKPSVDNLVIVPFISPVDSTGDIISSYRNDALRLVSFQPTNNDSIDLAYGSYLQMFFFGEYFLYMKISSQEELLRLLFNKNSRDLENMYDKLNKISNIKNNVTLRCLYDALYYETFEVIFLQMYNPYRTTMTGANVINDILENLEVDYDIYYEFGLRFNNFKPYYENDYSNPESIRRFCIQESESVVRTLVSKSGLSVLAIDTPYYKNVLQADQYNLNNLSALSNNTMRKVVSFYGWVLDDYMFMYPPTFLYFLVNHVNTSSDDKYGTIVNKKYYTTYGYKIYGPNRIYDLNSYIDDVVSDRILSNAVHIKDGYAIFLADRSMGSGDVLKYERANRIANAVAKVCKSVLIGLVGLELDEDKLENMEEQLNDSIQSSIPEVPVTFVIKDISPETNTIVSEIVVEYANTIYRIELDIQAYNAENN